MLDAVSMDREPAGPRDTLASILYGLRSRRRPLNRVAPKMRHLAALSVSPSPRQHRYALRWCRFVSRRRQPGQPGMTGPDGHQCTGDFGVVHSLGDSIAPVATHMLETGSPCGIAGRSVDEPANSLLLQACCSIEQDQETSTFVRTKTHDGSDGPHQQFCPARGA